MLPPDGSENYFVHHEKAISMPKEGASEDASSFLLRLLLGRIQPALEAYCFAVLTAAFTLLVDNSNLERHHEVGYVENEKLVYLDENISFVKASLIPK